MEFLEGLLENTWVQRILWSAVVVFVAIVIYRLCTKFLNHKEKHGNKFISDKKNRTYIRMFKSIVASALAIVTILTILEIFGVNVSSMLAGVGIASVVVGFALQDALKDIIRGFDIISGSYFDIGDLIKFGDNLGQVQSVTLRTTKIQDINTGNIVSIANRNIDKVEVDAGYIYIKVPLPYELKIEKADAVMAEIVKRLQKTDLLKTAKYQGLSLINASSLDYQVEVTCDPMTRLQARRNALHVIVETLEENKIEIPYTQLDLHNK